MKAKYVLVAMLVVAILGNVAIAYADEGGPPPEGQRPRGGLGGEVIAVTDNNLTLLTRDDETVVVNVSDETRVRLMESGSEGSLSDIEVGDKVQVRGRRNEDGSVDAREIVVQPEGEKVGGRVTAVDGYNILVENREGELATIVTDADTTFLVGPEEGSLADVTEGKFVDAFGTMQEDGSLLATLVLISDQPGHGPGPGPGPGPEPGPGPGSEDEPCQRPGPGPNREGEQG